MTNSTPAHNQTIEHKSEENSHKFLDAKKIILICVSLLVMVGLVILSVTTILKDFSFDRLLDGIKQTWNQPNGHAFLIFMLFVLLLFFVINFLRMSVPYVIRLKSLGIKVPLKDAILYYLVIAFLTAISPGILLTEPYTMFWLRTRGITTAQATAFVWINDFVYHAVVTLSTLPAFIYYATQFNAIIQYSPAEGIVVVILICVGFGINILMFAFYILSGFSRRVHYYLSRVFNRVKQFLHIKYHTKAQTYHTYIEKAVLFHNAKALLKKYQDNIIIACLYIIATCGLFFSMYASLCVISAGGDDLFSFSQFTKVIATVGVVFVANRYLPIPGGEGTMQMQMQIMLMYEHQGDQDSWNKGIDCGIFVWRSFTTYIPAIVGFGGFITYLISFAKDVKKKKTFLQK